MIEILINSVDRTDWIDWSSVQWEQGLTKDPDIFNFALKENSDRTAPTVGQTVELVIDSVTKFSGLIVQRQHKLKGMLPVFTFKCKDTQYDLDKILVAKYYEEMTIPDIIDDIFTTFTDGTFTMVNVDPAAPEVASIKFNYETVSHCLQRLADMFNYDWYVDPAKDLHFFNSQDISAPFSIDDTSGNLNFQSLNFDKNILELKNSIIVVGGNFKDAFDASSTPDVYKANGTDLTFKLIYRYSETTITVDDVSQTVGIDNITPPDSVDVLYNYQEKAIKFRDDNKPTNGQIIKIYGNAEIPLISQVTDSTSVATYGERQTLIKNDKIKSISEARTVAKAAIEDWAQGSYEGGFTTREAGLQAGQMIEINSTKFGVNSFFKINKVSARMIDSETFQYSVKFIASGKVTFTDVMVALLGRSNDFDLSDSDVLRRLTMVRELLGFNDSISVTKTSPPYKWGTGSDNDMVWGFFTWA